MSFPGYAKSINGKELLLIAKSEHVENGASVYERVARDQLVQRLNEARVLLSRDLRGNLSRIRELLADAADQADSLNAVTTGESAGAPRSSRLATAVLARAGGEPVGEFLLIPFGDVEVERPLSGNDFDFTLRHAESAVKWFDALGRKLAIDYEHQSFDRHNARPDGLRPAAGWIGGLQVRADGLWATDVNWTDRAKELLAAGEYRYFSPVIFWTDEDYSDIAGLGPVALTNDPAMHGVAPLAASRGVAANGSNKTSDTRIADVDDAGEADADWESQDALLEAEEQIAILSRQVKGMEADAFIERGMRAGKVLDSTSLDWREDYLRDAHAAEARLARSPVLRPPGRLVGAESTLVKGRAAGQPELYRMWSIEADDLQAFDKAVTSGRVRLGVR